MTKVLCASFILCVALISTKGLCEDAPNIARRFTLSSGYVEKYFNSNEGLVYFPLSGIQAYSKLFDVVASGLKDHWGVRIATMLIEAPISFWLADGLATSFHEFGHARAVAAGGGSYHYGSIGYGHEFKVNNYWSLSGLRFITPPIGIPGSGPAWVNYDLSNISPKIHEVFGGENNSFIVGRAAGLNNQMLLAKRIAQTAYERNGHMTYTMHYVTNKMSSFWFALFDRENNSPKKDSGINDETDPTAILRGYRNKGYNIRHSDLMLQSLLSLLSGTTYSLGTAISKFISQNDPVARPLEFFGFRVPDVNSYINSRGLSFEIESDYKISAALTLGLAYEFIWKGGSGQQFTPRVRYNLASALSGLNELWMSGDIVIGNGIGGSFHLDYQPFDLSDKVSWKRFSYFADFNVYHAHTLYGERNIPSLAGAKIIAPEIIIGLHLNY